MDTTPTQEEIDSSIASSTAEGIARSTVDGATMQEHSLKDRLDASERLRKPSTVGGIFGANVMRAIPAPPG